MKRFFAALLSAGLLLALCACGGTEAEPPRPLPVPPPAEVPELARKQLDPYPVTTRTYEETFTDEDGTVIAIVNLKLPQVEDLPQIDAYYQSEADKLIQLVQGNLEQARKRLEEARAGGWEFQPVRCIADGPNECDVMGFREQTNGEGYLALSRRVYLDWGDGEVLWNSYGETFDCVSQGRMQLGDFFAVPEEEYMPFLEEKVQEWMTGNLQTPEQQKQWEAAALEIDPLNFVFCGHLELMMGEYVVEIPQTELNDLLKDQWKFQKN